MSLRQPVQCAPAVAVRVKIRRRELGSHGQVRKRLAPKNHLCQNRDVVNEVWERARLARDARFDGRFFIGVTSTGIYCRPICPSPAAKSANVLYFESAAAAAEAGFRPCLRCRPEASPGTPAWAGAPTSVARALKLIAESALDEGSVEDLATRLGLGARHLRRLFLRYLGATPVAVAQTRRVHFAKKLIDETPLPMTQIALAAGFGSVRRFNTTFRDLYGRTPTELRRNVAVAGQPGSYRFRLAYRPPYDWNGIVRFLTPRATPGVESVTPAEYRRTISFDGRHGTLCVRPAKKDNALEAEIRFPDPAALFRIVERVRRIFDLGADPAAIAAVLGKHPVLRQDLRRAPGLRVPGCWDGFELSIRAVLGQQVSVAAATTFAGRLAAAFGAETPDGRLFPTAQQLAQADISRVGLTSARTKTIRGLSEAVAAGEIRFEQLSGPQEIEQALTRIKGIGPWTAQYVAMRLGEPDAFPAQDLYLKEYAAEAPAWSPWRAYAAMHLWNR